VSIRRKCRSENLRIEKTSEPKKGPAALTRERGSAASAHPARHSARRRFFFPPAVGRLSLAFSGFGEPARIVAILAAWPSQWTLAKGTFSSSFIDESFHFAPPLHCIRAT
jgi:hypothetical protein